MGYFIDDAFLIKYNEEIINIGYIDKKDIFYCEYIIYSNQNFNISKLMEYFMEKGTKTIDQLSKNNLITITKYSFIKSIEAEIYKLFQDVNMNSKRLQSLMNS